MTDPLRRAAQARLAKATAMMCLKPDLLLFFVSEFVVECLPLLLVLDLLSLRNSVEFPWVRWVRFV